LVTSGLLAFLLIDKLNESPQRIGEFYYCFIDGIFSTGELVWTYFKDTAVLLCISLAVTPAFKMRFWNIGAEGQTLIGMLGAVAMAFYFGGKVPEWLLLILMFVAAITAGAIWAIIPALFKAIWNTNETLFTLMMNYVAAFLVSFILVVWVPSGTALGELAHGHLPSIGHNYLLIIAVTVILTFALNIYLNYSKQGYEIAVVGESERTARYVGINVKKVIIRTMIISGVLCGLAGFLVGAGLDHSITSESIEGRGFTAIMVSWLAKFKPIFMLITAALVVFLETGASQISETFDVQGAMPDIIVGIILFFIIGCEFFLNYEVHFRHRNRVQKEEN
jgi:simple sugar transport system permease protein